MFDKNCSLVSTDLYEYDIRSCYYTILKSINYDGINNIDPFNKLKRNIEIGLIQKNNKNIANFLSRQTNSLIDLYLSENKIKKEEVVFRSKDGFICKRKLNKLNISIPIEERNNILRLIISVNRNCGLLIYSTGEVSVKGLNYKSIDNSYFKLFSKINYSNKSSVVRSISLLRKTILNSSNNQWFCFEGEGESEYIVPIKNFGFLKIQKSSSDRITNSEIDKEFLWETNIWMFCRPLLMMH
jgi:hypothetical protein